MHILPVLEVERYGEVVGLGSKTAVESGLALSNPVARVGVLDDVLKNLIVIVVDAKGVELHLGNHTEVVAISRCVGLGDSCCRCSLDILDLDLNLELISRNRLSSCLGSKGVACYLLGLGYSESHSGVLSI